MRTIFTPRNIFTLTTSYPGPELFQRPFLRSYYLLSVTLLLAMALLAAVLVCAKLGAILSWEEKAWIAVACLAMLMLWARAVRDWRRVKLVASGEIQPGTPLYIALQAAAAQIFYGLTFTFFVTGSLILMLGRVVSQTAQR